MISRKKIFITEDEFIVSRNLQIKLEHLGYEVTGTASTGEMAIQKIRENQPDLVLMDIMLNWEMDGIVAAKIIRKEFGLPIIFLTAYSSSEIYNKASLADPYGYIIKPFEEKELEISVAIALHKHNSEKMVNQKQRELEELNRNLDLLVEERTQHLHQEIHERKKAQDLQQRFFNIIEQTTDHVLITDKNGQIEYANPAVIEFTGFSRDEFVKSKPSLLKSGLYSTSYYSNLWSQIRNGNRVAEEIINKKKNGQYYTSAEIIFPLKNSSEEITHFAAVSRDYSKKKEFEKKLIEIQEEERTRISKDLHDGIGQSVTAIKLSLATIIAKTSEGKIDTQALSDTSELVDELTNSLRETSFALMPSILRDYGLVPAIKKIIKVLQKTTQLNFELNLYADDHRLPNDIELTLYRIIQEFLSNSIKYATATVIRLSLSHENNIISLKIEDNGIGFDVNGFIIHESGQGILNMKYRTQLHNGLFQLESSKNTGTTLFVKLPL